MNDSKTDPRFINLIDIGSSQSGTSINCLLSPTAISANIFLWSDIWHFLIDLILNGDTNFSRLSSHLTGFMTGGDISTTSLINANGGVMTGAITTGAGGFIGATIIGFGLGTIIGLDSGLPVLPH